MDKSRGQMLVDRLEKWIGSYIFCVDGDLPLVLALWAIGSWCFDKFYTWPYLVVSASVKGAGKTRVLELLKGICRNPFLGASPSPAFVLREIRKMGGHFTLLWDEAESKAASDAKSFFSEVINSGYRKGQEIGRAKGPDDTVRYPSYCPKAFALIGDPTGTIRDRSIIAEMTRGNAEREFEPEAAEGEALGHRGMIEAVLSTGDGSGIRATAPEWLDTRDREIWGAMFGLAAWLKLDKATMLRLERFAADNVAGKTAPKRRNTSYEDEGALIDHNYGERALRDLLLVMKESEKGIASATAVERMRALPTGPWRTFKGDGLTEVKLSGLVSRFGVMPQRLPRARGAQQLRGYTRANVSASLPGGVKAD